MLIWGSVLSSDEIEGCKDGSRANVKIGKEFLHPYRYLKCRKLSILTATTEKDGGTEASTSEVWRTLTPGESGGRPTE